MENFENQEQKISQTSIVKCDSCGSNMIYDAKSKGLLCIHCGSKRQIENNGKNQEIDIMQGFALDFNFDETEVSVFKCDNCGAKVTLSQGQTASKCPFCGTAHAVEIKELKGLKPNGVIPFSIDGDNALTLSKEWARKKFFAPRKFKKNLKAENVSGIYVPCFTFDSYTTSTYNGKIGRTKTRRVGSGKNARTVTYTEWQYISGTYYDNFDDIIVSSGSKIEQKNLDKILPYQTNSGKQFDEKYTLGFMAYHYDYEIEDCWQYAKNTIDNALRSRILSQYVYNTVAYLNVSTKHERVTFKYVMLPVYVGNYKYAKKVYNFFVNGESGKVHGKTPISALKVIGLVVSILAVVALIVLLTNL